MSQLKNFDKLLKHLSIKIILNCFYLEKYKRSQIIQFDNLLYNLGHIELGELIVTLYQELMIEYFLSLNVYIQISEIKLLGNVNISNFLEKDLQDNL